MSLKPPLPIWPVELETITTRRPTFRINGRFGATRYRLELSRHADFRDSIVVEDGWQVSDEDQIAPTVTLAWKGEPLADGQWFWRVFCAGPEGAWTLPANYRTFYVASEDRDALHPIRELNHPYLLISRDEVAALRSKIASHRTYQLAWRYLYAAAEVVLDDDAPDEGYARSAGGQHGNYSTVATWYHAHLEQLALAYQVSGERRFAERARQWLLRITGFERWLGPLFDDRRYFDPPWHAALETAMTTQAVAVAYDLLWEVLSEQERRVVREALVEKGIRPLVHDWADPLGASKLPRHQTATGNWVMVCSASAGVGALALLGEHADAARWVRHVRNEVRWWLHDRGGDWFVDDPRPGPRPKPVIGPSEPNFGIDGGYKESIGYMNYAMTYVSYFADALQRITGQDLFEHVPDNILEPVLWSVFATHTEDGVRCWVADFGDCGVDPQYPELYAALIKHRRDGRAQWLFHRITPIPFTIRGLLWHDQAVPERAPAATLPVRHFRTIGRVVMRTGWGLDDLLVAFKYHQNRGHRDLGQFFVYRRRPILIDSGSADYGGRIYGQYLAHSRAHNVILVDGKDQTRTDGRVEFVLAAGTLGSLASELAAAYPNELRSWQRELIFMPPQLVVVLDRLEGNEPHRYESLLHPDGGFKIDRDGNVVIGNGPEAAVLVPLAPQPCELRTEEGYIKTIPAKYLSIRPVQERPDELFVSAVWLDAAEGPPRIERSATDEGAVMKASRNGKTWLVWVGGERAGEAGPCRTDARLAAVELDDRAGLQRVVCHGGTWLRMDERPVWSSSGPIHLLLEYTSSGVRGAVHAARPARLAIRLEEPATSLLVDGQSKPLEPSDGRLSLQVEPGQHEFQILLRARASQPAASSRPISDLPAVDPTDAPIFRGVTARASSCLGDALRAIDGNPNTMWTSLPRLPMPQWLQVELPKAQTIRRVTIDTALPCEYEILTWDPAGRTWRSLGRFQTTPGQCVRTTGFDPTRTDRLRVVVHRIDPANHAAAIRTLRWQ